MPAFDRYHRQMLLPGFDAAAQASLSRATVLLVGCGALGTVIADMLARAGVGRLRIVDRDLVELTNLQRQVLFTEADAAGHVPKAVAAAERLALVNGEVTVEPHVVDFTHRNAVPLAAEVDLLLDGTDNFATRLLLNDLAVAHDLPYVYGGAVGTTGTVYPVLPGNDATAGPCLRCLLGDEPETGQLGSCDTVGVLGPAAGIVANFQAAEALKILSGNIA
ncbi:MAG: ThiF family adenylyltransferase, partial [Phycisphaeraceae bacterium]